MAGPFKMKGSPYPDKKSREAKRKQKEFKKNTVVIDGKTYNKKELEALRLAEATKKVDALQNQ